MKDHQIVIGRVYRWYPNNVRTTGNRHIVRVIRGGGSGWYTVLTDELMSVPYNYARANELTRTTEDEAQNYLVMDWKHRGSPRTASQKK